VKDRPKFTINPKIDALADEMFENVVRPRQTILDSEDLALRQFKAAAGIVRRGPF